MWTAVQCRRRHIVMWHHSPPQFTETPYCFDCPVAANISVTTDSNLAVNTKPDADKKLNQQKHMWAERTTQAKWQHASANMNDSYV